MSRPRTLVVVLAGGAGGRLELLTRDRAKPAVPYGGTHRLIDFPLSNCLHSGLIDVWVVQQFNPVSLGDHLSNGRPWDLDRTTGGLLLLTPQRGGRREGWHQGTADALWRQAELVRQFDPEHLVVVSADAVYRLDYDEVVAGHRDSGADVTMVTTEVAPEDAGRYGVVQVSDGRVRSYDYKPDEPRGNLVSAEVFVFRPQLLMELLDELADESDDVDGDGLEDLGHEALPRLVRSAEVREHALGGYWRDVGTVDAYWSSHMDLLAEEPPLDLGDPTWSIRTAGGGQPAAWTSPASQVRRSLLAPGSRVSGQVEGSVLSSRVIVEEGAYVKDSVLLPGSHVRAGARVVRGVVDDGVVIGRDARIGGEGELALVGLRAHVPDGDVVPSGARYPALPEDDDDGP